LGQILLVLGLAVAAGVIAYNVSLRLAAEDVGAHSGAGFLPEEQTPPSPVTTVADLPPGYQYAVLAPGRRSPQTIVVAFLGLVVLISLGALALAFSVYEIAHLLRTALDTYVGGATSSLSP